MSRLDVLVVDDEPLARDMLVGMLDADRDLRVVGTAADGREARRQIDRLAPDIVLMDIEMPEANGLEAARGASAEDRSEGPEPIYIFVTAYDGYAPAAFDVEALDYVLKPVSEARLAEALERAKRRCRERRLSRMAEQVVSLASGLEGEAEASTNGSPESLDRLPVTARGRTHFIDVGDIVWIESQDYYVQLHTRHGDPLVRVSLKSLERRLDPKRFCLVRRGALVNVAEVTEIQKLFKGAYQLVLSDGSEIRISRSRWREVRDTLAPRLRRS